MSLFFFNDTAPTEIYTYGHTLSLHDALPICIGRQPHHLHQLTRLGERLGRAHAEVHRPLDDRLADRAARIERAVRVLEHDLNVAPMPAQAPLTQPRDVLAADADGASGRVDQAHHATQIERAHA